MRLIDANTLADKVDESKRNNPHNPGMIRVNHRNEHDHFLRMILDAPTVDAVVLPCKIGDDVYIIPSKVNFDLNALGRYKFLNRVYHQKVAEIVLTQNGWYMKGSLDKEYGTDRILVDRLYKETWFLTEEEAEAALAHMDRKDDT